jgi:glycosyltransferase involved in cell wall biosynthesis
VTGRAVVLAAPYAPGEPPAHLGAAKKIELVTRLLGRLGFVVHLVDSSHPRLEFSPPLFGVPHRLGDQEIVLWRPACLPSRKLGKLLNVYCSSALFDRLTAVDPAFVWLYNSYAFEGQLGLHLRRRTDCPLVLELEDLPRARNRGLNPKPFLDELAFRALLRHADLVTFVNEGLRRRFTSRIAGRGLLFPAILANDLTAPAPPARFVGKVRRLGYFGGLERDKGVGVLLELLPLLPASWQVVVTGAGSLESEFQAAARNFSDRLVFHGRVSHSRVAELAFQCDAIVNPHASIANMRDGVFPFKVCEAIASGAVVISTALPPIDIDLSAAVQFYDGSAAGLVAELSRAPRRYEANREELRRVRSAVCERYGEDALLQEFGAAIAELLSPDVGQRRQTT